MEKIILYPSIVFSVIGLFLIYSFSPSQKYVSEEISEIKQRCEGFYETQGTLIRVSSSKNGNHIGVLSKDNSSILVLLNSSFFKGDKVMVRGQVNEYSNQCWFFPDTIDLK